MNRPGSLIPMQSIWVIVFILATVLTAVAHPVPAEQHDRREKEKPVSQAHPEVLVYDVIIDVGHGGIDGGASAANILEKQLNLEIGAALYQELHKKGYKVGITRLHDYALSDDSPFTHIQSRHRKDLAQRKLIADELRPKLFISIHMNMSSSSSARGPMILYQDRAESYLLADLLQTELNKLAQTRRQGKMTDYYFLLKHVTSPTIIAEVGYLSHPTERAKLQDPHFQTQTAQKMAEAIDHFFILYP